MIGTDAQFSAAQRQYDAAEPPPDTRECSSCRQQRDLGREVDGRFICSECLEADHRCAGCGQLLEDRDGLGERCRYCAPDEDEDESEPSYLDSPDMGDWQADCVDDEADF